MMRRHSSLIDPAVVATHLQQMRDQEALP